MQGWGGGKSNLLCNTEHFFIPRVRGASEDSQHIISVSLKKKKKKNPPRPHYYSNNTIKETAKRVCVVTLGKLMILF